ncbi:MAG: Ig-like domain-containing protein [Pseudomonadota bacterium]
MRLCSLTCGLAFAVLLGLAACGPRGVQSIEIRPGPAELLSMDRKGKTQKFTVAGLDKNGLFVQLVDAAWSSGDESVVTVDIAGEVTAVGSGSTDIQASYLTFKVSQTLTVRILDKLELDPADELTMKMGEEKKIAAVVKNDRNQPVTDARITWTMNGYAADVDQQGQVVAQAIGDAVLTARAGNATARIKITVVDR